jgi:hypothetical protein
MENIKGNLLDPDYKSNKKILIKKIKLNQE